MKVIQFIIENWDFILLIAAAAVCILTAVFTRNKSVVMKMLYSLVTEAERAYGGGTGSLKLAAVIDVIYPKLPAIIKMFITERMLQNWIEEALAAAKEEWKKNAEIAGYIAPDVSHGDSCENSERCDESRFDVETFP